MREGFFLALGIAGGWWWCRNYGPAKDVTPAMPEADAEASAASSPSFGGLDELADNAVGAARDAGGRILEFMAPSSASSSGASSTGDCGCGCGGAGGGA